MSYCRFRNTLKDLRDVEEHIEDEDLSEEEERAKKQLIEVAARIGEYARE